MVGLIPLRECAFVGAEPLCVTPKFMIKPLWLMFYPLRSSLQKAPGKIWPVEPIPGTPSISFCNVEKSMNLCRTGLEPEIVKAGFRLLVSVVWV